MQFHSPLAKAKETEGKAATTAAEIGKQIFLDTTLSNPPGQGCVSCHQASAAFADPRPVSPGAVTGRQGKRNSPSIMYAALIPGRAYEDVFTKDGEEIYAWEGGLFHDGRARDLFDQVQQPFFDRAEMNLADRHAMASKLRSATRSCSSPPASATATPMSCAQLTKQ